MTGQTEQGDAKAQGGAKAADKRVCECWDQSCQGLFTDLHEEGITTVMDRPAAQGATCRFDAGSADQLRALLRAVAVYASGGRKALQALSARSGESGASLLLQQM